MWLCLKVRLVSAENKAGSSRGVHGNCGHRHFSQLHVCAHISSCECSKRSVCKPYLEASTAWGCLAWYLSLRPQDPSAVPRYCVHLRLTSRVEASGLEEDVLPSPKSRSSDGVERDTTRESPRTRNDLRHLAAGMVSRLLNTCVLMSPGPDAGPG